MINVHQIEISTIKKILKKYLILLNLESAESVGIGGFVRRYSSNTVVILFILKKKEMFICLQKKLCL